MKSNSVVYNVTAGPVNQDKCNKYYRNLAYELHNVPGSRLKELTHTNCIGYVIKHIGHYENIKRLFDIERV